VFNQFDDESGSSRYREWVYTPAEYMKFGDAPIENPPLIHTSLKGLAAASWYLSVTARYIPTYGHTRVKYHFGDPDKNGHPFLVFKLWAKGNLLVTERLHPYNFIKELITRDLTPSFTKPPSFALLPEERIVTKEIVKEVKVQAEVDEYEFLVTLNEKRKQNLKKWRGNSENPSSDGTALPLSA
jgi:hypothetical protein